MKVHLIWTARVAVVLGAAALIGVAVAIATALLGHEVLVLRYGDDLSVIDDTLPMFAAVGASYLAGIVAGTIVLVASWRRFLRGRRTTIG